MTQSTTVGESWVLVHEGSTDGAFDGTIQMTSGFPSAFGRVATSLPVITDSGIVIPRDGVLISVSSSENFYARSYRGDSTVKLIPGGGGGGGTGPAGPAGSDGDDGWSPVFSIVTDGERRVQQVTSWTGGTGTPPASGVYVGPTGFVAAIADAVDIRGATGPAGSPANVVPSIHALRLLDIASSIPNTDDLTGSHQIEFDVTDVEVITAINLLIVGSSQTVTKAFNLPARDGDTTASFTITAQEWATLSATGNNLTFTLRGTYPSDIVSSNTVVVNRVAPTQQVPIFHGLLDDVANIGTIDTSTLTTTNLPNGLGSFSGDVTGAANNDMLLFLIPQTGTETITQPPFDTDVTSQFTTADNARTIGGTSYKALTLSGLPVGSQYRFTLTVS